MNEDLSKNIRGEGLLGFLKIYSLFCLSVQNLTAQNGNSPSGTVV